ncbi:MAG: hypothetical protein P0Y53_04355 [Candidatus Pseudobacter hemicellulosilyticus]|uniref:Uncharacterized protein n=1 Tax=Candidatus Pseudobacter hemicellulosilyticus TaxID=3121375 RepID=A0AAJ6BIX8_9BACT|nr:MAG: hypothetical protein P0Y53_04355 [Pseudobacter sp.]
MKKNHSTKKEVPSFELIKLGKAWLLRRETDSNIIHFGKNKFILIADNKRDAMRHAKSITSLNKGKLIVFDRNRVILHKFSCINGTCTTQYPRAKALH